GRLLGNAWRADHALVWVLRAAGQRPALPGQAFLGVSNCDIKPGLYAAVLTRRTLVSNERPMVACYCNQRTATTSLSIPQKK
ncbi:MAG: hypothetical protein RR704_25610, partial [Stenotrophomonas sp.]